jgi:hypothetical protein
MVWSPGGNISSFDVEQLASRPTVHVRASDSARRLTKMDERKVLPVATPEKCERGLLAVPTSKV